MFINQGFSTQWGKDKYNIGLDEVDLHRVLAGAGIPLDADLRLEEAEDILRLAGEYFCLKQRALVDPAYDGDVREGTKELNVRLNHRLNEVKTRLGLEQPAAV
jgi:hypothetical protein